MQKVKVFLGVLFYPTLLLVFYVLYKVYCNIKAKVDRKKKEESLGNASVVGNNGQTVNLVAILGIIWAECFDSWTSEDEDKIIAEIKKIPTNKMREFALLWDDEVARYKADWSRYYVGHKPSDLATDMRYFLEDDASEVEQWLQAI